MSVLARSSDQEVVVFSQRIERAALRSLITLVKRISSLTARSLVSRLYIMYQRQVPVEG